MMGKVFLALLVFVAAAGLQAEGQAPDPIRSVEPAPTPVLQAGLPKDRRLVVGRSSDHPETETWQSYLIHARAILTNANVSKAQVQSNPASMLPEVALTFDASGAEAFERFTADHIGQRLAIVLDDEVMSAPLIMSAIPGGRAVISLGAQGPHKQAVREAELLASTLGDRALACPVTLTSEMMSPEGVRFELALDLKQALREFDRGLALSLQAAMEQAGLPFEEIRVRSEGGVGLQLTDPSQAELMALALSSLPAVFGLSTRIQHPKPGRVRVGFTARQAQRHRDLVRARTVRALEGRLIKAGVSGPRVQIAGPDRVAIDIRPGQAMDHIKRLLLKRGRLEFVAVDDEDDVHLRLRHRLPEGLRLESRAIHKPGGQARQTSFWVGEGAEGKKRLEQLIQSLEQTSAD